MKTVFFLDLDTQKDFMLPTGALPVSGAERLAPKLRRLFDFARKTSITIVSSVHAHSPSDAELMTWPPHCLVGSDGQRKLDDTLLHRHLVLENRPIDLNLVDSVRKYQQIIIQRQGWDLFSNPVTERLLRVLPSHAIVFGVPTEHSIKLAAIGLQQRGVKAAVLSDMVLPLEPRKAEAAGQEMREASVEFLALEMLFSIYSS
jgi:nicotinamidase-related amidase